MIGFLVFACCAGIMAVDPYYGEARKRLLDITPVSRWN